MEPHALAKMVREGRTLDFDLGEIEVAGRRFGFGIMAGAGYDAAIMHGAEPAKRLFGPMAYLSAAIANPLPQKSRFSIELDDTTIESEGLGILLVNFSKIQFDITVTHENEPRDGVFDVVVLKAQNAFELIPAVLAGLLDRGGDFPDRTEAPRAAPRPHRARCSRPAHGSAVRRRSHTAYDALLGSHPSARRALLRLPRKATSSSERDGRAPSGQLTSSRAPRTTVPNPASSTVSASISSGSANALVA